MVDNIIQKRRSVYPVQYTGEAINDETIWAVLADANSAPSHRNTEPWRFKVYSGQAKEGLSEALTKAYKAHIPIEEQKEIKIKKIGGKTSKSSHILVVSRKLFDPAINPDWEEIASIACAVQNIYLSCTIRGLGCYWSTPKYLVGQKNILGLPDDEYCLGLVYIGVPDAEKTRTVIKQPIEDKVMWYS